MKKSRFFIVVLVLLLLFVLLFLLPIAFKFFIIKDLNAKLTEIIETSNNYIIEIKSNDSDTMYYNKVSVLNDAIRLDRKLISLDTDNYTKWIYDNNSKENIMTGLKGETNTFIQEYPAVELESKIINPYNLYFSKEGFGELLKTKITTITYNNKECYLIQNSFYNYAIVDKNTGLLYEQPNGYSTKNGNDISTIFIYNYTFNTLTEDVFHQ